MRTLATLLAFVSATALGAEGGECTKYYNLTKASPGIFAGFGHASSPEGAADAARADLAKQISARVSSTTRTRETNRDVSLESVIESRADVALVGARVSRRCGEGGAHEAVVTLHQDFLVRNLATMVQTKLEKASELAERLKAAEGPAKADMLVEARKLLEDSGFQEALALCKAFDGCKELKREGLQALQAALDEKGNAQLVGRASLFVLKLESAYAETVSAEVKTLLAQDGVEVSSEAPPGQVVGVDCSERVFPKLGESLIIEITCRATGLVDGLRKFSYVYSARGVGETPDDARTIARFQLKRAK